MGDLPFIADPLFYAVAIPAVLMVGIAKSGVGGTNAFGVALMSLAVSVPQAAAILLPLICLTDLFGLWVFRGKWDARNLKILLPGATLGMLAGWAGFAWLDSALIKLAVGAIAVWFATAQFLPMIRRLPPPPAEGPNPVEGGFWSTVCGFTSFVAHAGQPPLNVYMIPQRLDKSVYLGTLAVFYAYVNYFKLVPYGLLGQLDLPNLSTSAVLAPLVPLGLAVGLFIQRRLSQEMFYKVVLTLLMAAGLKLLYDAAMELI